MILHIVRIVGLIPLIVLCTFYPFLPGEYDSLAMSLSAMAQTLGLAGLLGVPVGIAWPIFELQKRARRNRKLCDIKPARVISCSTVNLMHYGRPTFLAIQLLAHLRS